MTYQMTDYCSASKRSKVGSFVGQTCLTRSLGQSLRSASNLFDHLMSFQHTSPLRTDILYAVSTPPCAPRRPCISPSCRLGHPLHILTSADIGMLHTSTFASRLIYPPTPCLQHYLDFSTFRLAPFGIPPDVTRSQADRMMSTAQAAYSIA